jgi:hypothetical protein
MLFMAYIDNFGELPAAGAARMLASLPWLCFPYLPQAA